MDGGKRQAIARSIGVVLAVCAAVALLAMILSGLLQILYGLGGWTIVAVER